MLKKVLQTIREHHLFTPGSKVVVAVSGGADSVALLDILTEAAELRLDLVVAHLNHGLRGEESDGDELFVRQLALHYHVPVMSRLVDVAELARNRRISLEDAGRFARYTFFAEVMTVCGATSTVLAHHADDQAETLLMRLLRGSAGTGLCGMLPLSSCGRYTRPLLDVTRQEIEKYLASRLLSYRNDSSNVDTRFLRNRIRHELIPALGSYNPAISHRLASTASALAADETLLRELTETAFARLGTREAMKISFQVDDLKMEHLGLRLRLYRRAILEIHNDLARISCRHLEDIDRLIISRKPQSLLNLPFGLIVARSYGVVSFLTVKDAVDNSSYEFQVDGQGNFPLPGGGILRIGIGPFRHEQSTGTRCTALFDVDKAPFPWIVRTFRAGDTFVPRGMSGTKKVKNLFIDKKIPSTLRCRIPLLLSDNKIIWIGGLRASEGSVVAPGAKLAVMAEILDFTP